MLRPVWPATQALSLEEVCGDGQVKVELTNRMILTPYAAKRLNTILTRVMREYEARHGVLTMDETTG